MKNIYTEERKVKIQKKIAETPKSLLRDSLTDYTEGYFHITLNVHDGLPILGVVEGNSKAKRGEKDAPHVRYTKLGQAVKEVWMNSFHFHSGIEIVEFEAMPEHIHCLIYLKPENKEHLGKIVNGIMIGCTHAYWDELGIEWKSEKLNKDAAAFRKKYDKDHTRSYRGPALFVHGYNDVEAVTAEEVATKIEYIRANPERRLIKGENRAIFTITRRKCSRNWNLDAVKRGLTRDRWFKAHAADFERAFVNLLPRLSTVSVDGTSRLCIDYLGNRDILNNQQKVSLVCHKADAALFEKQVEAVMNAARNGAVIVSAFISAKERAIRDRLISEQLPVIELVDNGFNERYKPYGKSFYACAEGWMMQMSCWNYVYSKQTTVSREMCMAMNELARIISGVNDDWWKLSLK